MSQTVKVRFAPSPTGFLHIGSARTALFNWLFAKHEGGKFFIRIEDTDRERSKDEFLEEILDSLKWLGLDWDDELLFQSKRTALYRGFAERLIKEGKAYYEDQAIRFRVPKEGKTLVEDALRGTIEFDNTLFEDLVIFKSDGSPTYNFAVVCDDATLGITHVIRGDDHISNTPKQTPLYEALGFKKPIFCHIPLILGKDRSRLSKRHGATSIREYRERGFLPEAMINYLALLGWSPGNNQEIITLDELIQKFDLKRVLKTGAAFNQEKFEWVNAHYLRQYGIAALADQLIPFLEKRGYWNKEAGDRAWLEKVVALCQERIFTLGQFADIAQFFFEDKIEYNDEAAAVFSKDANLGRIFGTYADALETVEPFDHKTVEEVSRSLMTKLGMSGKQFIHPCRVAVTGRSISPGFFETLTLIGKKRATERLRQAAEFLKSKV